MKSLSIKRISHQDPLYPQVLQLRNDILRKPIGLNLFDEDLSQEKDQFTFACTQIDLGPNLGEEKVIGCVMLQPTFVASSERDATPQIHKRSIKLRQMAVLEEYRGQAIGAKLVGAAEEFVRGQGITRIHLNGRKESIGFYAKLGFSCIREIEFLELALGIPHFAMEKRID